MSDIGLLSAKMNLIPNDVLFMTADIDEFKGGLTENYVNQQLTASGYTPFFWTGEKNNEVDFVIQREGVVLPIEVKAGDHVRSTSLNVFAKRYGIEHSIRISSKNFGYEDGKKLIPHYAMFCLSDS
jgi:predicted AAA+ superfamily ATPase